MTRFYSLAYLTSCHLSPPDVFRVGAELGYHAVGFRFLPNMPGGPQQHLIGLPELLRETLAVQRDTGLQVLDMEIIRIGEHFDATQFDALFELGAALKARAVLVAGDDTNEERLAASYARLCERMQPYQLSADLEFMPWTAVDCAATALRVIHKAGSPANAGILTDALHFGRSDTTLADIRSIPRHLLHYAQICDAKGGRHFSAEEMIHTARCERLLAGEGDIDVTGLFAALPPDLPVSVEVIHNERMARLGLDYAGMKEWARICLANAVATLEP